MLLEKIKETLRYFFLPCNKSLLVHFFLGLKHVKVKNIVTIRTTLFFLPQVNSSCLQKKQQQFFSFKQGMLLPSSLFSHSRNIYYSELEIYINMMNYDIVNYG